MSNLQTHSIGESHALPLLLLIFHAILIITVELGHSEGPLQVVPQPQSLISCRSPAPQYHSDWVPRSLSPVYMLDQLMD